MTILITMKHAQLIKKGLGLNLPHVKSSHRAEAMARGLGWKSNAALRAALMCGPAECQVDDDRFGTYLSDKGFDSIGQYTFSKVVTDVMALDDTQGDDFDLPPRQSREPQNAIGFSGKWGAVAFGLFAVICYLLATVETADQYLEREMAQSLDMSEKAAQRSVLILDADLADEVVSGFLKYPYVANAEILNDHGDRMAFRSQPVRAETLAEEIQAIFGIGGKMEYRRVLEMPPTMEETPGALIVKVDRARALSILPGPTWGGMFLSLLIGLGAVALSRMGQAVFRVWMRLYLAQHYRLAHS